MSSSNVSETTVFGGATTSAWDWTASAFPAKSTEKNFTVVVPTPSGIAAVYAVLEVVGVLPSVV